MKPHIICTVTNDLVQDRRMLRIVQTLYEHGFRVTLVGRCLSNSLPTPTVDFQTKRLRVFVNAGPLFYVFFNIRLFLFLIGSKADVFNAVDTDTLLAVRAAGWMKGIKITLDAHEWFEEVPELVGRNRVRGIWMWVARWCIPATVLRYTVSAPIAQALEHRYGYPFGLIRNYPILNQDLKRDAGIERVQSLVYLGVLNEGRGLEQMILAMHQIDAKFWIVGSGDIEPQLRDLVKAEKLEDKIEFMGFKTPDQLRPVLLKSKVGINLLDDTSESYRFSLANKFFDYVHAGLPQVTMNFPTYRSQIDEHEVGVLINNLETAQIVDAVNSILLDEVCWQELHRNCLLAKKDWNWEREESKLVQWYQAII